MTRGQVLFRAWPQALELDLELDDSLVLLQVEWDGLQAAARAVLDAPQAVLLAEWDEPQDALLAGPGETRAGLLAGRDESQDVLLADQHVPRELPLAARADFPLPLLPLPRIRVEPAREQRQVLQPAQCVLCSADALQPLLPAALYSHLPIAPGWCLLRASASAEPEGEPYATGQRSSYPVCRRRTGHRSQRSSSSTLTEKRRGKRRRSDSSEP